MLSRFHRIEVLMSSCRFWRTSLALACAVLALNAPVCASAPSMLPAAAAQSAAHEAQGKFLFVFGPAAPWSGRLIRWRYNAAGAPAQFPTSTAVAAIQGAMNKWSAACNVGFAYDGETTIPLRAIVNDPVDGPVPDQINVVGWGAAGAFIPTAAGVTFPVPYLDDDLAIVVGDADIMLDNAGHIGNAGFLDQITLHEVG